MGGPRPVDRDQHVTPLPGRDLRQRRLKDLDVVGGGERPGVPWALHHHQMLPGVGTPGGQRVEPDAALVVPGHARFLHRR